MTWKIPDLLTKHIVLYKTFYRLNIRRHYKKTQRNKGKNDCTTTKFIFTACHKDLKGHAYDLHKEDRYGYIQVKYESKF